ncbi:MAG: hypothetical protein IAE77_03930, partial [Prosthecobacter sp.]|uniref:DUF6600 domain-containing protein n=1 Tax=Prosthecobacter sp. TaxID=1965333 RepID=UPI001A0D41EA
MKTLVVALTALLVLMAPVPPAQAQSSNVDVSIDFFYDALQPYGDWIYVDGYGYCWEPFPELVGTGWQPYTDGYWAYTDAGWTWITDEPFGWATYHYGRWMLNGDRWCWVPGYEWAPAWVSWRQSEAYIGWAPLPPEAVWSVSIGFGIWTDSYYDIGPGCYNFVPYDNFACRTSLRPFVLDRHRNSLFIDQSVNITNISYNHTVVNHIFVGGPDVNRMDRFRGGRVPRFSLRRDDDGLRRDWLNRDGDRDPRHLFRVNGDRLLVASPHIRRDERPGLPSRVRERVVNPQIDRGWRLAGSSDHGNRWHSQGGPGTRPALPSKLPERRPVIATSTTPPPAVGRTLTSSERRSFGPRNTTDGTPRAEPVEVRRATAADQPPATRPGSPSSDPRSRFNRPDALPIPGSQRPEVSERGSGPSRTPSVMPEGRPPLPGSGFRRSDDKKDDKTVRPGIPSPFGPRSGIPQTSRPPETKPEVRPAMPSRSERPTFTPPSRSNEPQRPTFTPPSSSRFTPPSRSNEPQRPSFTPPSSSRFTPPSRTNEPQRPTFTPPSSSRFTPPSRS